MELTQQQIDQMKSRGLTDSEISNLAAQKGLTMPQKKLSNMEVGNLQSKGLSQEEIQTIASQKGYAMPKDGVISGMFRAITEPVVTLLARPAQAIKAVAGATENQQAINLPYYGRIETSKSQKDVISDIGRAAQAVSLGIGGAGTAGAVRTGLGGKILAGAAQEAKVGAASGGLFGFGEGLQEAETQPADVAMKTLFGAGTGAAGGALFGAVTPIVVKGAKGIKTIKNADEANKYLNNANLQVFAPTKTQFKKFQGKDTIGTYTEIFGGELPSVDKNNRFTTESVQDFASRVDELYKPASEAFSTILRNSPETVSLSQIEKQALSNLDNTPLTPTAKEQAINKIKDEFAQARQEAKQAGWLYGDDALPVFHADQFKDRFWAATKNFGTPEANTTNAVNLNTGHAFKSAIENAVEDIGVREFNQKLSDLIVLRNFVQDLTGKQAATGGKMTKLMTRLAGTMVGASGGPLGSIAGGLTGDALARILIDPKLQPYRWLINKQLSKLPESELMRLTQEANDVIAQMAEKRAKQLLLPAPTTQFVPPKATPNQAGFRTTPIVETRRVQ